MDELMRILQEVRPDVDFSTDAALIDEGLLDSFDVVMLVGEMNDAFDISIPVGMIVPENFNSAEAMLRMIKQLQEE